MLYVERFGHWHTFARELSAVPARSPISIMSLGTEEGAADRLVEFLQTPASQQQQRGKLISLGIERFRPKNSGSWSSSCVLAEREALLSSSLSQGSVWSSSTETRSTFQPQPNSTATTSKQHCNHNQTALQPQPNSTATTAKQHCNHNQKSMKTKIEWEQSSLASGGSVHSKCQQCNGHFIHNCSAAAQPQR